MAKYRELRALTCYRGIGPDRFRENDFHRFGRLLADDHHGVGARSQPLGIVVALDDDAGLLAGDLGNGVAEVLGVVDTDGRDDRNGRVDDVRGVPATAHADLDHRHVDRRVGEGRKCHGGDHLELAHPRAWTPRKQPILGLLVDELDEGFHLAVGVDVSRGGDRLAVDGDALHGRLQMRAGGAPGATVQGGQERVDDPGHRRLPVGARDVDGRVCALG
jgi:hypothetical protein